MRPALRLLACVLLVPAAAGQIALPPEGRPVFRGSGWAIDGVDRAGVVADVNNDGYPDLLNAAFELSAALNNGHGLFLPAGQTAEGPLVYGLAAGDLDGDGRGDAVGVGKTPGQVQVWLGGGDGSFAPGVSLADPELAAVVLVDLDLDGALDAVAAHDAAGWALSVMAGDGAGGLGAPQHVGGTGFWESLAAADFDLDGDTDLALGSGSSNNLSFAWSDGAGGLALAGIWSSAGATVAAGDVDGDGAPDLVTTRSATQSQLTWRRNQSGSLPFTATKTWDASAAVTATIADTGGDGTAEIVAGGTGLWFVGNLFGSPGTAQPLAFMGSIGGVGQLLAADVDADGRQDVVAFGNTTAQVLFGQAGGTLELPATTSLTAPGLFDARYAALGDLDGDGEQDLACIDTSTAAGGPRLARALGTGGGTFASWAFVPTEYLPFSLELGDLDGDGALDAVASCYSTNGLLDDDLAAHLGDGAGGFGAPLLTSFTADPGRHRLADFDGDGSLDALVDHAAPSEVRVWQGDGAGHFAPGSAAAVLAGESDLDVADLDGDGDLDVAHVAAAGALRRLSLLRGDGAGGLQAAETVDESPQLAPQVLACDADLDGLPDLALAEAGPGSVRLYRGLGGGAFGPPASGGFPGAPGGALACGDVTGDGLPDIVQATGGERLLLVVPGDGQGGWRPGTAHPSSWSLGPAALSDFDDDGRLDALVLGSSDDVLVLHLNLGAHDPWLSVGGGVPGAHGQPRARGTGEPLAGEVLQLEVTQAPPGAPAVLVLGLGLHAQPLHAGLLVPTPDLILAAGLVSPAGELLLADDWPGGALGGIDLWFQLWLPDLTAPGKLAATGGLRLRVP